MPDRARPTLSWYRGHSPAELVAAVTRARGLYVRTITPGRVVFAGDPDGPVEAWGSGSSWLVGDPADLRAACDGAAVEVVGRGAA